LLWRFILKRISPEAPMKANPLLGELEDSTGPEALGSTTSSCQGAQIGFRQGRIVTERHDGSTERFELLLAEFLAVGKEASAPQVAGLAVIERRRAVEKARRIVDELVQCCHEMDSNDERRRFFAMTLIVSSALGSDLLGFNLLESLEDILLT
jgi:hypothetical protein